MNETNSLEQRFYEMLMDSQFWPHDQLVTYQRSQLTQLLNHAKSKVPFYETRLNAVFKRNGEIDWERWQEIPILKRQDMLDHRETMHASELPPGHGDTKDYWSSGTTGVPVTIRHNGLAFVASRAAMFRANRWHHVDWSKNSCDCSKGEPTFAPWPDGQLGGYWGPAWDEKTTGRVWHINRQATPEQLCQFLSAKGIAYLGTRPKTAQSAAIEALRLNLPVKLDAIFCHGTGISEDEIENCRRAFGAKMIGLYSSTECQKIAHPCPDNGKYHINAEIAFVEIIDDSGHACRAGDQGRVIVTPFLNTAQPLIRFDQGDTAIAGELCSCGRSLPVIDRIIGRTTHLFRMPDGRRLSLSVPPELKWHLGADTWQLAQVGPLAFEVRYVERYEVHPGTEKLVVQNMRDQLSHAISVRFVKLDALPLTASGKFIENICELAD